MYTAELKRPLSESRAEKRAAVEATISKLALQSCRWARGGDINPLVCVGPWQ